MANANYAFPTDANSKAGAVAGTPDGNNFYVPTGAVMVSPALGNVLNQVTANSGLTQTSAVSLASPANVTAPAAGSQADLNVTGMGFLSLQVIINGAPATNPTATLSFFGSADGTNFIAINGISKSTGAMGTTATGLQDIYTFDVRGLQYFRVLVSNYVAGTAGSSISATGVAEGYAGTGHFMSLNGTSIMQPVDIQGIYYKSNSGYDALPIYSPDGISIGAGTGFGASAIPVADFPMLYNNSNYDRMTNNYQYTLQSSTAKTATFTTSNQTNYNARGFILFVNVTAVSGTSPTLQPIIQIVDSVSNSAVAILTASATITGTGMYTYGVYPTAISGLTQTVNFPMIRQWNTNFVIGGTTPSFTFSVGVSYIL